MRDERAAPALQRAGAILTDVPGLPSEVLSHVLSKLCLVHEIAAVAQRAARLSSRAQLLAKARPFSSVVVTLAGHTTAVQCVASAPDGRVITGSIGRIIRIWRDGACERTIVHKARKCAWRCCPAKQHLRQRRATHRVKLWTLDDALERISPFAVSWVLASRRCPTACTLRSASRTATVRLYHVDGTLVHTFKAHADTVRALAVTPDGQHIISGSKDKLVKVWSVATKSLVSDLRRARNRRRSRGGGDARRPAHPQRLGRPHHRGVAPQQHPQSTFYAHHAAVEAVVALPDNQHALSGSQDSTIKLFNVNDGTVLRTFTHHAKSVWRLALLPDGLRFVSGSADKTARIAYHGLAP